MRPPSIRMELVQVLMDEAAYFGRPHLFHPGRANWAEAYADALADREAWGGPPLEIQCVTDHGNEVLARWRRMANRVFRVRAERVFQQIQPRGAA